MAGPRYDHRLDFWTTRDDALWVEALAQAEASTSSAIMRRLVRLARYQAGAYQQPQPAE
jgi:hypothetical protein